MKIVKAYPPNIDMIRVFLTPNKEATYCYGNTIYNPSGKELSPDIEHHEYIHSKQQGDNPEIWWYNYLNDIDFRLEQEIQAYGEQYKFAKEHIEDRKLLDWALESMSRALSGKEYGSLLNHGQANSKIRNYSKTTR